MKTAKNEPPFSGSNLDTYGNLLYASSSELDPGGAMRTSYVANYFDPIARQIAVANYGALASFTRPAAVPARSDDVLVNSSEYNPAGEAFKSIDPKDLATTRVYDQAGRLTRETDAIGGETD